MGNVYENWSFTTAFPINVSPLWLNQLQHIWTPLAIGKQELIRGKLNEGCCEKCRNDVAVSEEASKKEKKRAQNLRKISGKGVRTWKTLQHQLWNSSVQSAVWNDQCHSRSNRELTEYHNSGYGSREWSGCVEGVPLKFDLYWMWMHTDLRKSA